MEDSHQSALEFLQQLETRHSNVLDELDTLNARIEKVLGEYTQKRQPPAENSETSSLEG